MERENLRAAADVEVSTEAGLADSPLDLTEIERVDRVLAHNTPHMIFEGGSTRKTLLVVFSYIDQPIGTRAHSRFLEGIDCKKLFLNPGRNHWFQSGVPGIASNFAGVAEFVATIRRRFVDHKILCLGHSMGAFAALGIGLGIRADRILASSPEVVLNLPGSISVRYLRDVPIGRGDLTHQLAENRQTSISILVGRRDQFDIAVARRIATMPGVEIIEIDSDHATFPHLRDIGRLQNVLRAFVDGRSIAAQLAANEMAPHVDEVV